jgi:hypothetical protein
MAASFFHTGAVDLYVLMRHVQQWYLLGTSVTAPVIEARILTEDVTCDWGGDAPYQKIDKSEQHVVTANLNRVNYRTFDRLRTRDVIGGGVRYKTHPGRLLLNYKDFRLFLRYTLPSVEGGIAPPDGAARGRLYYSAKLGAYRESTVQSRVNELGLVIECNPLWDNTKRVFDLWSENEEDFPPENQLTE